MALTIGPPPFAAPSDAALRAAWVAHRDFLLATTADVAALPGFWAHERGVPDALRREPPALYPIDDTGRVRGEWADLLRRRRAWLSRFRPDLDDVGA